VGVRRYILGKSWRFSRNRNPPEFMGLRRRCAWRWGKTPCFYRHFWHRKQGDPDTPDDDFSL